MTPTTATDRPPTPDLLELAADLRARGSSWEAAAERLGTDPDDLRRLARAAGPAYRRLYHAARAEVEEEATAEATAALRRELQSDDDRTRRLAADTLLKLRMTQLRHRPKPKSAPPPADDPADWDIPADAAEEQIAEVVRMARRTPWDYAHHRPTPWADLFDGTDNPGPDHDPPPDPAPAAEPRPPDDPPPDPTPVRSDDRDPPTDAGRPTRRRAALRAAGEKFATPRYDPTPGHRPPCPGHPHQLEARPVADRPAEPPPD